ncbi:MAG: hypothetical protein COA78_02455 [Blastopirellula sp.]|nr:MAG: hypothetical protein COA78_02455 [Blastopirellula sp.]
MSRRETIRQQLERAAKDNLIVRVYRSKMGGEWEHGYVVGMGDDFIALESISNSIYYDGYRCILLSDVTKCDVPDKYSEFLEKALRLRGLKQQGDQGVDYSSAKSIIQSVSERFPLVTIHQERLYPNECYIGSVDKLSNGFLELQEIDPGGIWCEESEPYKLSDITKIAFGGAYEEALFLAVNG